VVTVAVLTDAPPYSYQTPDGEWQGLAVDLWNLIAAELHFESRLTGAGLTGGRVYLYDLDGSRLNRQYVRAERLDASGAAEVQTLLKEHVAETSSKLGKRLLKEFDPARFSRVTTSLSPEPIE